MIHVVQKVRVMLKRIRALFRRVRQHAELDAETRDHLDSLAADHLRRGLSPADARTAARREFGGVEQIKEQYRDGVRWRLFDHVVRDVRYILGMVVGVVVATIAQRLASTRVETAGLYGVPFAFAAALLLTTVAVAVWLPAVRAARINPAVALRQE